MPSSPTASSSRDEVTGHSQLPLTRIKKIIAMDSDISACSSSAAFVITMATEMFIQYLAEQGHHVVKSERKPRKNIQYRDLASAVSRHDNLEFLSDIVPKTVPFKEIKQKRARAERANNNIPPTDIDASLLEETPNKRNNANDSNGFAGLATADDTIDEGPTAQLEMETQEAHETSGFPNGKANGNHESEDVEMS